MMSKVKGVQTRIRKISTVYKLFFFEAHSDKVPYSANVKLHRYHPFTRYDKLINERSELVQFSIGSEGLSEQ